MGDHQGTLKIELDDNTMKIKPFLKHLGGTCRVLRFD